MPKKRKEDRAAEGSKILAAHVNEQMEAASLSFLRHLEHFGVQGCLYLTVKGQEDKFLIFSSYDDSRNYKALLTGCSKMAEAGLKTNIDKQ
jgi:hypothetical protein